MKGSCACGGIQYELSDNLFAVNHCHCSICRKVHGAAFGTFGHAKAENFRWLRGEEAIASYKSSEKIPAFMSLLLTKHPGLKSPIPYLNTPKCQTLSLLLPTVKFKEI